MTKTQTSKWSLVPVYWMYSKWLCFLTHDKAYAQRKSLLVEKFVCLRQRRGRILRGRSRAERPQDSKEMKSPQDREMDTDRQQDK